jgi:tetratricopeptide (TPR) repeat protein/type II secretory pathway predicted ATPase ExeA
MPSQGPIGREPELDQLVAAAEQAAAGTGSIVFLSGSTGSGKSFLLKALADRLGSSEEKNRPELVSVACYETSADNPLAPFGEVLRALTSKERRGERAKRVLEVVGQVAPPLLELIPVIGKLASIGVKAGADLGAYALGGNHEAQQAQLAVDVAAALQHIANDTPLAVVIDDAHWIDASSTEVIARLSNTAEEQALLLLVAYDPDLVNDREPLAHLRAATAGRPGVRDLALDDLTPEAVKSLVRERYGAVPAPRLPEWLCDQTDGSPLFIEQYLTRLEEQGVIGKDAAGAWSLDGTIEGEPGNWSLGGALKRAGTPATLLDLMRPRVADLEDDERALLETGAVQGRRFLSTVLVKLLDKEEDEILDRLAQLAERRRMIASEDIEDWWSDRSALYAFDPGVLQELLYGRYAKSPYERHRRHRGVAEALETLIAEDNPPPRHALLEIARHYEEGDEPLKAGARLVEVAESTFAEGADRETAVHAERAVDLIRHHLSKQLEGHAEADAQTLLARAILLALAGGEPSWRVDPSSGGGERLLALAKDGEEAAERSGNPKLKANARYATATVLVAFSGLDDAIAAFREALDLAQAASDPLARFAILVRYGVQLDSVDLKEGWKVMEEARDLIAGDALKGLLDDDRRVFETARLESSMGVGAFDLGRYGEAIELLTRCSTVLRKPGIRYEAAWALAFLGQVHTAIGLYDAGEKTLQDGIAIFAEEPGTVGTRGYLRALLGRLYLEWEPARIEDARPLLAEALEETTASGNRPLISLVKTHWAELLLAEGKPDALREAEALLTQTTAYGYARIEIAARTLRARVALLEKRTDDASKLSTEAVEMLRERGGAVPAVRSEEVLFTHARVLEATKSAEAKAVLAEAAKVVHDKAESLTDPAQKQSYLTRVRLSRDILAAAEPVS